MLKCGAKSPQQGILVLWSGVDSSIRFRHPPGSLEKLRAKHAIVVDVRGIGLMVGMGLSIPAGEIVKQGHARGLLLNVTHDTVLRFVPPLVVTESEIDAAVAILDELLAGAGS